MGWWYLAAAIVFEICGTTALKLSDGMSRMGPAAAVVLCYGASFGFLSGALKRLDLGLAYAVWAGVGTAAVAAIGILWFREAATVLRLVSLFLVVAGVVGLNLSGSR